MYVGAFRKVLLAFQSDDWIENYVRTLNVTKFTPSTICSAIELLAEISRIRKHGYATSFGERIADAAGIAAPVFDHAGHFRAAIQLAGPVTRINKRTAKGFIPAVLSAAESNPNVVWKISICGSNRTYGRPWANGDQNLNLSGIRKIEIDQGLRSTMGSFSSTTRTHAIFPIWMSLDGRSEMVSG